MEEIGKTLREARTLLGLTLEEAERSTRIRTYHLEALERGDLNSLPSQVQARGFLRNYADYLGLDSEPLLNRYSEVVNSQRTGPFRRARFNELPTRPAVRVRTRRFSADLVVAAIVTLAVLAVLIGGFGRVAASLRERNEASSPFLVPTFTLDSEVSGPGPLQIIGPSVAGTLTPSVVIEGGLSGVVDLRVLVEKRAFVSVEVDGIEVFRGRPSPGQLLEFQGDELIKLTTGNAGGLRAFFRGQDQGLLGELDEVVVRLWTLSGAITPTPSVTPSATPEA